MKGRSTDSEDKEAKTNKKQKGGKLEIKGKLYNTGRWTEEEHNLFMKAIKIYGKDWKKVQQFVGTRTSAQSRSHAQKVLSKALNKNNDDNTFVTPTSPLKGRNNHDFCVKSERVKEQAIVIGIKKIIIIIL